MSKKRSNSFHKPATGAHCLKKSETNVAKKKPLQIISDYNHENITRQKSIPKVPKDTHIKKPNKNIPISPPKKKNQSPKKHSSGKKSRKSRCNYFNILEYDSPSK